MQDDQHPGNSPRVIWPVVARTVLKDELAGLSALRSLRGRLASRTGGSARANGTWSLEASVDYARSGCAAIRKFFGQTRIQSARILELGPGENQAVALCLLAAGAKQVVGLDRFNVASSPRRQQQVYDALRTRMPDAERHALDSVIDLNATPPRIDPARLKLIVGRGIENADEVLGPARFDLIFSVAVGEHLYDSDLAFSAMDRLLAPGGMMVHQIDLNDHGMFTEHGLHPLTWLTIPDPLYRRMVQNRGGPNRRLVDYYRMRMESLGYRYQLLVSQVAGDDAGLDPYPSSLVRGRHYGPEHEALVESIRPKLCTRYQRLSDRDLLTAGILLVANKPL